jgi:hypothetical protein
MATVFVRHPVSDYDTWRPRYDEDAHRRDEAGLTEVGVFQDASDPNSVLVVWNTDNVDGVEAMLADEDLEQKMQDSGVLAPPEVWIAD